MKSVMTEIFLVLMVCGVLMVSSQEDKSKSNVPENGTAFEEVVVETSLHVKPKPESASRRQRLLLKEKGALRSRREISHSTSHSESKLKSNALNPSVGHEKHSAGHSNDIHGVFFDKGFNNGASKAEQRAFYKQKPLRL